MTISNTTLYFIVPGDINTRTGGFRYDKRILEGLPQHHWDVKLISVSDEFPDPSRDAIISCAQQIASIPDGSIVIVDGLVFGVAPEIFEDHTLRLNLVALIHHPLAMETGLTDQRISFLKAKETRALGYARHIITTSNTTAGLLKNYQVPAHKISIVCPGTDTAPLSHGTQGSDSVQMLCVASFTPRKGHAVLFDALRNVMPYSWHLNCAGNTDLDRETYEQLHEHVEDLELNDRISFLGVLDDEALKQQYMQADVFVMASYFEGYGMVFDEAIAYGLPIIATTGGAIENTVPAAASILVPPGDSVQLGDAFEQYLNDGILRQSVKEGALRARDRLRDWTVAVQEFSNTIKRI